MTTTTKTAAGGTSNGDEMAHRAELTENEPRTGVPAPCCAKCGKEIPALDTLADYFRTTCAACE